MDSAKLDLILKKIEVVTSKVNNIESKVTNIENTVNNYVMKDISNLEKRIEVMERKAQ